MIRIFLAVLVTALSLFALPLAAQEAQSGSGEQWSSIAYDEWNSAADRAEKLIADRETSSEELSEIREEIVRWRQSFQQGQNVNGPRIKSVRQQIEALGAPPAEGQTEDDEIAQRREDLNKQLSELQAPRIAAAEAASRASAIIDNIAEIQAFRAAAELTESMPPPFMPSSWAEAASSGAELAARYAESADAALKTDGSVWEQLKERLPSILSYLVAAAIILTYGRWWVLSLPKRISVRASEYSRAVVVFLVSLGQIIVPLIGIYLLVSAIEASNLAGEWTIPILGALPSAAMIWYGGRWLAQMLFPAKSIAYDTLEMPRPLRIKAYRTAVLLSSIFALHHIMAWAILPPSGAYSRVGDQVTRVPLDMSDGAASVFNFILILLAGLTVFRLGNILRSLTKREDASSLAYRHRLLSWVGSLSRVIAVLSVLLGFFGLINLANYFLWPWILTVALICLLIVLQDFIADVFAMMHRGAEGAREGLTPLLIGFGLIILSIPLFLLIWGERKEDLAELWLQIRKGFTFGGITLSPGVILTLIIVFAIGYTITRGIQGLFRNSILPKTKLDSGAQNAVVAGLGYVGIFIASVMAITSAGIDLSSLAILASALSVGIGFGLQNIVSNFVSGIILMVERPVSVGDWIEAGGQQGIVKRISVRSTMVETFDKTEVIVPNSDLISQPVTNWTRHNKVGRIIVPVGVSYGSDTRQVEKILKEIIEDQPLVTIDPPPSVLFRAFGADSMDFEIRAILSDVGAGLGVTSEVLHQIAIRFAEEGIEVPHPQRDIWLRNPEALQMKPGDPDMGAEAKAEEEKPAEKADEQLSDDEFHRRYDPRVTFDKDADDAAGPDADADGDGDGGDR